MSTYYTIITNTGKAQFATASQNTTKVNITHLAVGDGNGTVPTPNGARTALVKETARVAVNKVEIHATNKNWIEVHAIIPSSSGGYTVRELGLYAGTTLIAIGSFPATYKPSATEGGAREMSIKAIIAVDNASVVNVTLDNSLVYATQKWVEDNFVNHNEVINTLTATDTDKPLSAAQGKALQDNKADKATTITAGNGLTGGGTLQASRTVALGTPSQITASTTNSVTATSHTHAIDKASTTVQGIVQLNDTLASTATDQALTANQGKVLNDKITATDAKADTKANQATTITAGNGLTGGGTLQASRTVALGTPSQITASTTNSVTATSHTHAIDKASTTVAGVVQLVDNLTTDDATKALTAKQGKALHDNKLDKTANAVSASKLANARTINGVAFDGTANITITDNTKAPTVHRHNWSEIDGKPSTFTPSSHTHTIANITDYDVRQISTEDLNGITKWGIYGQSANNQSLAERNYPVPNEAGTLEVMPGTYGLRQRFTTFATHRQFERSRNNAMTGWSDWTELSNTWSAIRDKPSNLAYTSSNVASATKLQNPRNIAMTGDGSWNVNFDGSANASGTLTLANSGVTAGSYNSVTVDAKGRVTRGLTQVHGLITATTATGTANQATTNTNTYLNIVASGVGSTASVGSSTQVTGTNGITVSSDTAGKLIISRDSNSPTATQLQTARTINGVAFDGTANITIADNTKAPAVHRHNWGEIDGKPSTFAPSSHTHSIANITDFDIRELGTDNLDDITKWGVYAQMANTNATAARNYPVAQEAGTLEVMISTYGLRQRFTTFKSHRHFERRRNNPMTAWENWIEVSNTWDAIRNKPSNLAYTSSNVASASRLATARTISLTGAVTGSVSFDGSGNVSIGTTLPSIASNVVVMTGTIDHGGTIPLPNGFTESQCKWMVSMHEDNTGNATWDLWESARLRHYGFRCFCDGRIVTAQAYLTGHNSPPGWVNGRANYIIIGVK